MKIKQLEVFHAVYSNNSITAAAKKLNVSQPAVSKTLKNIENDLGFPLFHRIKRKLIATEEGNGLFNYAQIILDNLRSMESEVKRLSQAFSRKIRVACSPSLGLEILPNIISEYNLKNPTIEFSINTQHLDQMVNNFNNFSIDIALTNAQDFEAGREFSKESIFEGKFRVLAPSDEKIKEEELDCKNLINRPFIKLESSMYSRLEDFFIEKKFTPNFISSTDTYHLASKLVSEGMGYTIIDELSARTLQNSRVKSYKLLDSPSFEVSLLVSIIKGQDKNIADFISFLKEHSQRW